MNFLVKFVLDAAARKLEAMIAKSVNADMPVLGRSHPRLSNPAANVRRKTKREIGARQYKKQVKALRRAALAHADLPLEVTAEMVAPVLSQASARALASVSANSATQAAA